MRPQAHENKSSRREGKKAGRKQLLSNKRSMISVVPLGIRCFRYPRSLGSIFIMPSIGANFFGKARGVCGNLLEKQFPLFLYALFLLSKCLSLFFIHALQSSFHRCFLRVRNTLRVFIYYTHIRLLRRRWNLFAHFFRPVSFDWSIIIQQHLRCLGHRIFGGDDMKRT